MKDIRICSFHVLVVKLLPKEIDSLNTNLSVYSFKSIHLKVKTFYKIVLSLSDNFTANQHTIPNTDFIIFS